MDKLEPPPGWGNDSITKFFEVARENGFATFHNLPQLFNRLVYINDLFESANNYMNNSPEAAIFPFFLKSHSSFLGAIRLATSGQSPETYMLLRGALESSLYGLHIKNNPELAKVWLSRHENEEKKKEVKKSFATRNVFESLKKTAPNMEKPVRTLYERCIDYGAHPNEASLTSILKYTETADAIQLAVECLTSNQDVIKLSLKSSAQVGVLCLRMLELIIPERFQIMGLSDKLNNASKGL